jgi:anti-anti-sigma factor
MSDVSFVSSLGVRHLVLAAKMLDQRRGKLVLFALTEPVAEVMHTMGIDEIIVMAPSEKEAQGLVALDAS